jgi:acyl-coenzyme A thioesterase PaaI-like protein
MGRKYGIGTFFAKPKLHYMKRTGNNFQIAALWRIASNLFGMRLTLSLYPPYFWSGIRVRAIAPDYAYIDMELRMRWWNRNYVGTHFGGSLYSMCDPLYMFMLLKRLGDGYIVWDKSARIDFVRPGLGRVRARFEISESEMRQIREKVERERKTDWDFETVVTDEQGAIVARVFKQLYIRKMKR